MNPQSKKELGAGERAYRYIQNAIVFGTYADNTMLTEGELADEVGLSRTPVREALLRLAAENLITLVPKRGALVRPLTHSEWREIVEVRLMIEEYACRSITKSERGPTVAAKLQDDIRDMESALAKPDLVAFVTADRAFHATLIEGAGNRMLAEVYEGLRIRQMRATAQKLRETAGLELSSEWPRIALQQHVSIAEAVNDNNMKLLVRLVREHLSSLLDSPS